LEDQLKSYKVKIKGLTALLMHRFPEEELFALLNKKAKKKTSEEPKTPREIAEKHSYKNSDGSFYIPGAFICGAFIKASSDYKRQDSARKSLKSVAAGAFRIYAETIPLMKSNGTKQDNFEVDIRKATNHKVGAVAVCRPRFDDWGCEFEVSVDETIIDPATVHQILEDAGRRVGIGSFRVSNGGYFGQYEILEWNEIK
jgi:hypothetical protein